MIELYSIVVQYNIIQDRSKDPRPNESLADWLIIQLSNTWPKARKQENTTQGGPPRSDTTFY